MQKMRAFETLGALLGLNLEKLKFFLNLGLLANWGGGAVAALGDFFAAQTTFVGLKEAPKQTLCLLLIQTCYMLQVIPC